MLQLTAELEPKSCLWSIKLCSALKVASLKCSSTDIVSFTCGHWQGKHFQICLATTLNEIIKKYFFEVLINPINGERNVPPSPYTTSLIINPSA